MAATGTPTPNIGLRIPLGTDPASVDDINYNSNLIDTKLGAVGNDSVQDQIDDLNSKFTSIGMGNVGTLSELMAAIINATSAYDGQVLFAYFGVSQSFDSDVFQWLSYCGTIRKSGTSYYGNFTNNHGGQLIVGTSDSGTNNYYIKTVGTLKT